ncbi:MAG: class I SAM-dependent methyltransferase, partial [Methylocella sp.]
WRGMIMSNDATNFAGNIPEHYDRDLGPVSFVGCAADLAHRLSARRPLHALETAAGHRNRHPPFARPSASLLATNLNPPILEMARMKCWAAESVAFEQADVTALPLPGGVLDAVVYQFGVMFFSETRRRRSCRLPNQNDPKIHFPQSAAGDQ